MTGRQRDVSERATQIWQRPPSPHVPRPRPAASPPPVIQRHGDCSPMAASCSSSMALAPPLSSSYSSSSSTFLLYRRHHHPHRRRLNFLLSLRASGDHEDEDLQAKLKNADWRAFRARLLQKASAPDDTALPAASNEPKPLDLWAHAIAHPEPGCLLVASPTAFLMRQQYFHQAVIFLFAHSKDGSAGLILNRPTQYNLGQLAGFEELLPDFSSCPLYMGGDVGANALHVVHGVAGLADSVEIIPGVYMGGLKSMKSSVQKGESSAQNYRWFVRYAGWAPGQLEREIAMGVWYPSSSSKDVILKPCIQLPKPLWREVLEYMGGPYLDISKRAYGEI